MSQHRPTVLYLAIALAAGCDKGAVEAQPEDPSTLLRPTAVRIITARDTIAAGDTLRASVEVHNSFGDVINWQPNWISWTVQHPSVASVDSLGTIVGRSTGVTEVSARVGSAVGRRTIRVDHFSAPRLLRGHYFTGFEASGFIACGDTAAAYVPSPGDAFRFMLTRPEYDPPGDQPPPAGKVYVEWRAAYSAAGHYGHLGVYRRELRVDSLYVVRAESPTDCS